MSIATCRIQQTLDSRTEVADIAAGKHHVEEAEVEFINRNAGRINEQRSAGVKRDFITDADLRQRRRVQDGEVEPACVQSCPTEAMVFGDSTDPDSKVSQVMNNPRAYTVLKELNTSPSIVYLKKVQEDV